MCSQKKKSSSQMTLRRGFRCYKSSSQQVLLAYQAGKLRWVQGAYSTPLCCQGNITMGLSVVRAMILSSIRKRPVQLQTDCRDAEPLRARLGRLMGYGRLPRFREWGNHGVNIQLQTLHQAVKLESIHHGPSVIERWLECGFELSNEDLLRDCGRMVKTPSQNMPVP